MAGKVNLPSVDALFGIPTGKESVQEVSISLLHPFKDHPFQVQIDEKLLESVQEYGILSPLLVRKRNDSAYEIISGHRRCAAATQLGMGKLPVLIRELTDEEATILMVDSNIQRENLLPSEKAFAYRMKLEAIKAQGKSSGRSKTAREVVAEEAGVNRMEVSRYIRLTYLIPTLLASVDNKKLTLLAAVELSYLSAKEQEQITFMPSLQQAKELRRRSQEGAFTTKGIVQAKSKKSFTLKTFKPYFPKGYSNEQMMERIVQLLKQYGVEEE